MAFKSTGKNSNSGNTFKATKRKTYDSSVVDGWKTANEEAWNTLNSYQTRLTNNEWLSEDDRNAYKSALDNYISTSNSLRGVNKTFGEGYSDEDEKKWQDSVASMTSGYDGISKYYSQWESEDEYNHWYNLQAKRKEYESILSAGDFEANKGYVSTKDTPDNIWEKLFDTSTYGMGYDDLTYEYINNQNGMRDEIDRKYAMYSADTSSSDGESTYKQKGYAHLKEEEVGIYNYLYATQGADKAQEYLDSLETELVQRKAGKEFERFEGNTLAEIFYGFAAGVDQFKAGIKNLGSFVTGGEGFTPSSQYVSGMIREDLADNGSEILGSSLGQIGYDLTNTTGNMLPSVLVGTATGGLGGALTLGASVTGNAYNEMRSLGYDEWQSRGYGALVGASETVLSYALGGISKLGGKVSGNVVSKLVSKIDNALAKTAITLGGNMLSEGLEESIQTVLEPAFKALMTGEDFESPEWDEILYSGLLGALSAGMMEGAPTIAGKVAQDYQTAQMYSGKLDKTFDVDIGGKTVTASTNQTKADRQALQKELHRGLVTESLEINPESAYAKKMQGRLDKGKTLSGNQLNSLIGANESTLVAQDKAKIKAAAEARLTELGETGNVGKIAEVITKIRAGEDISKAEQKILTSSKYGRRVSTEMNPDIIEGGGYTTEWAENLGTERISTEAYNRGMKADGTVAKEAATPLATPTAEKTAEPTFKTSENGKTMFIPTDGETEAREVSIKEIASIKNGEVTLRLEDGSTVSARDVELGSDAEGLLYENVVHMGLNPATANAFVKGFNPGEGLSAEMYANGFREAYRYGTYGIPMSEMSRNGFSAELTEAQRTLAYNLGKTDAKYKFAPKQAKTTSTVTVNADKSAEKGASKGKKGKLHNTIAPKNERQRASLKALGVVAEALGIDIYTYESEVVNGKRQYTMPDGTVTGANGWFDKKDNSIHIDLYAGASGEGTMLFTASHELTHFIREWSPDKFKTFADFLFEQYGEKGASVDELIEKQIKKAKQNGRNIDYDTAYEEVVADACEMMLTDSNALEKIAELKAKDKTLWQKIKEFITKLCARIKAAYEGLDPDSEEADYVREMKEAAEKLQALWTEALMDAGENYQSIGARNMADFAEAKNENGEQLFQYRAMEADEDTYRDMLRKWGNMTDAQIANLFTTIDKAMDIIKDNLEALDYAWEADIDDRAFSPVKPNSDKLYQVSLDYSTLCRKRILQQTVQAQLQEALNKPLSREEGIAIRDALIALQNEGRQIEVACALCYVESARMKSPKQIGRFMVGKEQVIKEFFANKNGGSVKEKVKQAEADARKRLGVGDVSLNRLTDRIAEEIRAAKKAAREAYIPTAEEQKIIDIAKGMNISDFTSPEGLENLAKKYPSLFDVYTSYIRNATHSKGIENDTWWRAGDSAKIGDTLIANMNKENGLRSQSWSDFQVIHILDYIASTIELATRNTKEQAYTKVPDYAELMGNTGVMINLSLIPKAQFSGSLEYDSVEGIDYKRSLELRDKYHDTVGTICIGIDNEQIRMLLADNTIDYVIPYHRSSMAAHIRKAMHIPTWSEYENYQSEKKLSRAEAEAQAKKYGVTILSEKDGNYQKSTSFSEWFDIKEAKQIANMENANPTDKAKQKKYGKMYGGYMAMQNAANNYLKLCAERGLTPKFSHEKADFTGEENYWKLLIDRKMVDNITGDVIEQRAIKPIFDEREVLRILNDELERYPKVKADQEYAIRKVSEAYLSGKLKGGMSAEDIAEIMQKPVDNVTTTNIIASAEDVMYSDRDSDGDTESTFSYDELVSKGDIIGFTIKDVVPVPLSSAGSIDGKKIVAAVREQCQRISTKSASPKYFIEVADIGRNVEITEKSITHGFFDSTRKNKKPSPRDLMNAQVSLSLPQILANSIEVNRSYRDGNRDISFSHIMMGTIGIKMQDGKTDYYAVRSVVEERRNLDPILVEAKILGKLHAINAKKIDSPNLKVAGHSVARGYDEVYTYSISDFLQDVKSEFDDTFSRDVYKKLGKERRENFFSSNLLYSERDPDFFTDRSLLAEALESAAQNDIERSKLADYKKKIDLINAEQAKFYDLRRKIKELSFAKGKRDIETIKSLQLEAKQTENRINIYDRQLLSLEATAPLKAVVEREKVQARKRAEQRGREALKEYKEREIKEYQEFIKRYRESHAKAIESRKKTAMRNKIKNVVADLDKMLRAGKKERNVKEELKETVTRSLELAKVLFSESISNEDIVRLGVDIVTEKESKLLNEYIDLLDTLKPLEYKKNHVYGAENASEELFVKIDAVEEKIAKVKRRLAALDKELADVFERERARYNKVTTDEIIGSLADEYLKLKDSGTDYIKAAYDEFIYLRLDTLKKSISGTIASDMNLAQLAEVYDAYKTVLHFVRNANKAFKSKKGEAIATLANRTLEEIEGLGRKRTYFTKAGEAISTFDWNNQKPIYAFERIGSGTFTEVFENVRAGEDTWAIDMDEARTFREEQQNKADYKKWDFKKKHTFTSSTGKEFQLTLGQIMSLYAYAKRGEQAKSHLRNGGFVFDGLVETEVTETSKDGKKTKTKKYRFKDSTAYNISEKTLADIISTLEEGQRGFVDAMQDYLSTTMGAKGNEVSMELYGVELFNEDNYFPLKSAPQFLERAREQANGDPKIKNKGFTKETVPEAKNPIALTPFMDVWANHVNEMSMYHAFTLPLEDFYRIYNYKTQASETADSMSVISSLENAHGSEAVAYIDQLLLRDLNGGARSDSRENIAKKAMSNFKKASVMASLSVLIQQPSAIVRAQALVDAKHFIGKKVSKAKHKELWAEVKKYAPVAIIKEMGYFDVGMGKSSAEWLKGEKTWKDKMEDFLSLGPAKADEYTWCAIWQAVKRETLRKNPKLSPTTEEFLKMAGERFTEVIAKTQVYDSTLSRSANMRSKSGLMQMWTAFMAEPTTSINMLQNAFRKGNRKSIPRVMGAVYGSVLLNSALVSLVYAMRDDDEDETWWEKYFSRLTTEIIDGINPLTYIPFVKDIWSAAQGFDVERADMTLITSLFDSMQGLINVAGKDTADMEEEEKKEHDKKVTEAILSVVGDISSLTGIPAKNVLRDFKGIINGITTIMTDAEGRATTKASLGDAILGDLQSSIPVWGWFPGKSKGDKVYGAAIKGDEAYAERLKNTYKSDAAYTSAIRKALRENDPRIKEAAKARFDGNTEKYLKIAKEILAEKKFTQENVMAAINAEFDALKKAKKQKD